MPISQIEDFKNTVKQYFQDNYRPMPWRENTDPYFVFISEVMLQQTQVKRVVEKFTEFIKIYPDFESLAESEQTELLQVWSGLGYNRRALYLKEAAKAIVDNHKGKVPADHAELVKLKGIGSATASAILVYSYNKAEVYIETNIRTAFLHHFFKDADEVSDDDIFPFIEECLDRTNPREWYWALMDYGTYLKKTVGNLNKKSKSYSKQSKFEGSRRQKRGMVLKVLLSEAEQSVQQLAEKLNESDDLVAGITDDLIKEGFVEYKNGNFRLKN